VWQPYTSSYFGTLCWQLIPKLTHEEGLDNAEDTLLQEGEEAEEGVVGSEQPQEDAEEAGLAASATHHLPLLLLGQPRGLHFSFPFPAQLHCKKRLTIFPSPAGNVTDKTLPGRE
jgi:hypothetical protein